MIGSVLYVDDEVSLLNAFRRQARLAGFEVEVCSSAEQGLERLAERDFDVVCSDYRMGGMDGLRFLHRVREVAPYSARILITAYHEFEVAVRAVQVGVFRLIPKPWQPEVLRAHLEQGVEGVRSRRENERLQRLVSDQVETLERLNATLDQRVARRTEQVLEALVTCLDYRDEQTMAHSKRVSLMARAIATEMGIEDPELTDIEWGAMLHDMGKIGVPDAILLKRGSLTETEWRVMRRHVPLGASMICRIDFLADAARVVGDHHERYDGSGYPDGKRGQDIYIGARIFAVADTFDAITSDRPYRAGRSVAVAEGEIRAASGTQLDPDCVEAFFALPRAGWSEIREQAGAWARGQRFQLDGVCTPLVEGVKSVG